ncbi:hypothetical protein VNO77_30841 [Canavalia gladiata]|uniref:Uncharacterized protein n=1 Tax=Canavalia gladiata TaxID=3824 RepID=A0AAN9KNS5_CANGL
MVTTATGAIEVPAGTPLHCPMLLWIPPSPSRNACNLEGRVQSQYDHHSLWKKLSEMASKAMRVFILEYSKSEGADSTPSQERWDAPRRVQVTSKPKVSWLLCCKAMQPLARVGDKRKAIHGSGNEPWKDLCMLPFPAVKHD